MPMKRWVRDKWRASLTQDWWDNRRSTARLREYNGRMCCLGMLCNVIDNTRWLNSNSDFVIYKFPDGSLGRGYLSATAHFFLFHSSGINQADFVNANSVSLEAVLKLVDSIPVED